MSEQENTPNRHLDEITLLLYVERQLDRESAQEVSLHTQTCTSCMTLLRALDRESRLLTRSMLEEDEPLPARIAEFRARVKKSMQWIWGVVFGLAALGVYALSTVPPGSAEHRALTGHCSFRVAALFCLVVGYVRMRRELSTSTPVTIPAASDPSASEPKA